MELIKFTPKIYAVKGAKNMKEAIEAVIRKRKKALYTTYDYEAKIAYIGSYNKDEYGLWIGGKDGKTNCIAVEVL